MLIGMMRFVIILTSIVALGCREQSVQYTDELEVVRSGYSEYLRMRAPAVDAVKVYVNENLYVSDRQVECLGLAEQMGWIGEPELIALRRRLSEILSDSENSEYVEVSDFMIEGDFTRYSEGLVINHGDYYFGFGMPVVLSGGGRAIGLVYWIIPIKKGIELVLLERDGDSWRFRDYVGCTR